MLSGQNTWNFKNSAAASKRQKSTNDIDSWILLIYFEESNIELKQTELQFKFKESKRKNKLKTLSKN